MGQEIYIISLFFLSPPFLIECSMLGNLPSFLHPRCEYYKNRVLIWRGGSNGKTVFLGRPGVGLPISYSVFNSRDFWFMVLWGDDILTSIDSYSSFSVFPLLPSSVLTCAYRASGLWILRIQVFPSLCRGAWSWQPSSSISFLLFSGQSPR